MTDQHTRTCWKQHHECALVEIERLRRQANTMAQELNQYKGRTTFILRDAEGEKMSERLVAAQQLNVRYLSAVKKASASVQVNNGIVILPTPLWDRLIAATEG